MSTVFAVYARNLGDAPYAICHSRACAEQWVRTQVALHLASGHADIDRTGDGALHIAHGYHRRYAITEMPVLRHGRAERIENAAE